LNLFTEAMRVSPEDVTAETLTQLKTLIRNIVDTPVFGHPPDRFGGQKGMRLENARAATADRPPYHPTPRTVARPPANGKPLSKRPPSLVQPVYDRRAGLDHAEMRNLQQAYPGNRACINCGSTEHFVGKCTKPGAKAAQQRHSLFMKQRRDEQDKGTWDLRPKDSRAALSFGFSNGSWADQVEQEELEEMANIYRAASLYTALDLGVEMPPQHEPHAPQLAPHEQLRQHERTLELEPEPNEDVLCPVPISTHTLSANYKSKIALLVVRAGEMWGKAEGVTRQVKSLRYARVPISLQ